MSKILCQTCIGFRNRIMPFFFPHRKPRGYYIIDRTTTASYIPLIASQVHTPHTAMSSFILFCMKKGTGKKEKTQTPGRGIASQSTDLVVGVGVGDEVGLGTLEDGGDCILGLGDLVFDLHARQQLVGQLHLHQAAAVGRGLHLDVRHRRLDGNADGAALDERVLALALVQVQEVEPLLCEGERMTARGTSCA